MNNNYSDDNPRPRMHIRNIIDSAINIILSVVETFLSLRFLLKLLGASPQATFVDWWYKTTEPLIAPFIGAFPTPVLEEGIIIEFSTLFAMLAYAILGYLLIELINFIHLAIRKRRNHS
jgi:uncharacterized protein YggT (Ycf19 family)